MSPPSRPADDVPGRAKAAKRKFPRGGPSAAEVRKLREKLIVIRGQLLRSSKELASEALKSSGQDFSVDHMADYGSDNFDQDFSLTLLQGEAETLEAIDLALRKIDGSEELPYALCESCGEADAWEPAGPAPWIPTGRLEVLPYARLCVAHQEEEEGDGP